MRKHIFLTVAVCLFTTVVTHGQTTDYTVQSLKLNSSPAYTILGVEPTNIQRPSSPTDFVAGAQSAVVNGQLQPNFAMETTPYYWTHKNDSARFVLLDYLGHKNFGTTLLESFTVSLATSSSDTFTFGSLKPGTGYGVGMQVTLFSGKPSKKVQGYMQDLVGAWEYHNAYNYIIGVISTGNQTTYYVDDLLNNWGDSYKSHYKSHFDDRIETVKEVIKAQLNKETLTSDDLRQLSTLDKKISDGEKETLLRLNAMKMPLTREGFMWNLAIADAGVVENNEWQSTNNGKTAIWTTASYRFNTAKDPGIVDYLDITAISRLTFNAKNVDSSNYVDGGIQVQYTHSKFSVSSEFVARFLTQKPETVSSGWTWKGDISMDYKVNDFVTFKATFGSNFDGNSLHYSDPKKMFAVGGFNFGFSNLLKSINGSKN